MAPDILQRIDLPDPYVQRMPFSECTPATPDGIRKLAMIAVETDPFAAHFVDALELRMLKVLRIKPDGYEDKGKPEPVELIHHRGKRGREIRVRWVIRQNDECDACGGDGRLEADGNNGRTYKVECPECYGVGSVDGDSEEVITDLDGKPVRRATNGAKGA